MFQCNLCEKVFDKSQSYCAHRRHCKLKQAGISFRDTLSQESRNKMAWSRGLTKESDERVRKIGEALSTNISMGVTKASFEGKKHSEVIREKISIARSAFIEANGSNVKWYPVTNGEDIVKVQGTWELRLAMFLNSKGIKWVRKQLIYEGHRRYTPDFYLIDLNFFIEVKGWFRERDKDKMSRCLKENNVDIRILGSKKILRQIETGELSLNELPVFDCN